MHLDSHLIPLAFLDLQPWLIAVFVPIAALIFAGAIIFMTMHFNHRRQELWHQTARLALEKGQPLPAFDRMVVAEPTSAASPQPRWRGYLVGGLINLAIGAGLFLALSQIPSTSFNVGSFGFIPGFIGIALLIGAMIEGFASRGK
ncbi:MAG TPA: DUF6249 domain-containing protein [Opitutus sp.]|nr:DUF6249 domain-containing protein [Opitutus sp.]